jgi:hypothetical protein
MATTAFNNHEMLVAIMNAYLHLVFCVAVEINGLFERGI